jgi:hypothetical protein
MSQQRSRRHFLTRAAAILGGAALPLLPSTAGAGVLGPARRACACGGSVAVVPPRSVARQAPRLFENRVGWAYSARWGRSRADIRSDLRRMRDLGCNVVYIGHNSAGDTNPDAYEPGLAPSDWYAIAAGTPEAENAHKVAAVILATIEEAGEAGLDVVLGIGYQIMMGDEWNAAHLSDLRRNARGDLLKHWGSVFTASPYSETYRRDIGEYYGWVNQTFVTPYPNVVALNLADEPMGSDFSPHAMAAFAARYGRSFEAAPDAERGEFLAGVVSDYAAWSANAWKALNPDVRTMMTFHIQRDTPFLPDVERIFAQTPDTFVFSADTHLDDGPVDRVITPEVVTLLYGMTRTLGWLSRVYKKPLMLWTSANAWGLKKTGGTREALLNLDIVHDTPKQVGGLLGMLMIWGWNIRYQGVYDDAGNFPADKESMIATVSQAVAARREQLSRVTPGQPSRVYQASKSALYAAIGAQRFDHLADGIVDLTGIDFANEQAVYLTDGPALEEARRLGVPITPL